MQLYKKKWNAWSLASRIFLSLMLAMVFVACQDCEARLEKEYQALYKEFHQEKWTANAGLEKVEKLKEFVQREEVIFSQIKSCSIKNPRLHNKWYRGRMKFPSQIQMARDRMRP